MASQLHNARTNWFLTWDEQPDNQKSFLLQVKLQGLSYRDLFSDTINSFVLIYRRPPGHEKWQEIGRTAVIHDELNPEYPEGFRVCYEHQTDLSADMLKVVCFNRRDTMLPTEDVIGTAKISVRELVRTFGTRVQVELVRKKTSKIVGSVWFVGEALPMRSPRGSCNVFQFNISLMSLRRIEIGYQTARLFLLIEREREDSTWSVVYRSDVVKRRSVTARIIRNHPIPFKPFQVRQSELVLGMTPLRKVRFSFFQKWKRGEAHTCVAEVLASTDELVNDFLEDTSLDMHVNGEVVGEFACISRNEIDKITTFDIHIDYFNSVKEARQLEEKRRNNTLHFDSP